MRQVAEEDRDACVRQTLQARNVQLGQGRTADNEAADAGITDTVVPREIGPRQLRARSRQRNNGWTTQTQAKKKGKKKIF